MIATFKDKSTSRDKCRVVRRHIAQAMVGRAVDLLVDAETIVHGVVTGVLIEAGSTKLVVGGTRYDLNQILTATPVSFDQQPQPHS